MNRWLGLLFGLLLGALLGAVFYLHPTTQAFMGVLQRQAAKLAVAGASAGLVLSLIWHGRPNGAGWVWQPLAAGFGFLTLLVAVRVGLDAVEHLFPQKTRTVDLLVATGSSSAAEAVVLTVSALVLVWLTGLPFVWLARAR